MNTGWAGEQGHGTQVWERRFGDGLGRQDPLRTFLCHLGSKEEPDADYGPIPLTGRWWGAGNLGLFLFVQSGGCKDTEPWSGGPRASVSPDICLLGRDCGKTGYTPLW